MLEALSLHAVRPCISYVVSAVSMGYVDFHQTSVSSASCGKDELIWFWGQKVKIQGHSITEHAKNTVFVISGFSDVHYGVFKTFIASASWDSEELIRFCYNRLVTFEFLFPASILHKP